MLEIFVDADACPVKEEIYRVATRCRLNVILVANAKMRIPQTDWLQLVVVDDQLDAADNWIVENAEENDIVVTTDIPLASRALAKNAYALDPKGRIFTDGNICNLLGDRELLSQLREMRLITGGPAPFQKRDRSKFLQSLNQIIEQIRYRSL